MNNKKITLSILFIYALFPLNSFEISTWFSAKKEFRNGFEFLQVSLQADKFILAKLSYNKEKQWEETRVIGNVKELQAGEFILKPEMCMVYATKKLGLRWILIQGFDCDHLNIYLTKNGRGFTISPSIGISEKETLIQDLGESKNAIGAIVISNEDGKLNAWSLGMRYIKKGAKATLKGNSIKILETVDSTGVFESIESAQIGDTIYMNNPTQAGMFD